MLKHSEVKGLCKNVDFVRISLTKDFLENRSFREKIIILDTFEYFVHCSTNFNGQ